MVSNSEYPADIRLRRRELLTTSTAFAGAASFDGARASFAAPSAAALKGAPIKPLEVADHGARSDDWAEVRDQSVKYFRKLTRLAPGLDLLEPSTGLADLYLGPIDWVWGSDQEIATKIRDVATRYIQKSNQVEFLLSEAVALIDRAASDVQRYDALNVERYKVLMEFREYDLTERQDSKEEMDDSFWFALRDEAGLQSEAKHDLVKDKDRILGSLNKVTADFLSISTPVLGPGQISASAQSSAAEATAFLQANQFASAASEGQAHTKRRDYEEKTRKYQSERRERTKEIIASKLTEMQRKGGAINYAERMEEIGRRVLDDFLEVCARMHAIELGLRAFYDVSNSPALDMPHPSGLMLSSVDTAFSGARTRVEGAVRWLRQATNVLGRARMDDQDCVLRVTIEDAHARLLGQLRQGRGFVFPTESISGMRQVRLRAISASVEPIAGDCWLDLEIESPSQVFAHLGLSLPKLKVRLGRVSSSASLNSRDFGGGRPIVNRSPEGLWTVTAIRDFEADKIRKLHLDFHLTLSYV